jgi:phospholipase/lecithinase/hemolysin
MKKAALILQILALSTCTQAGLAVAETRYIFFGDSLVDNGNSYIATDILLGVPSPSDLHCVDGISDCPGRYSNGANWTDLLAPTQYLYMQYYFSNDNNASPCIKNLATATECDKLQPPPVNYTGSLNFSFGASTSGDDRILNGPTHVPGFMTQVDDLSYFFPSIEGATAAVWTGGNDYSGFIFAQGYQPGSSEAISTEVDRVIANIESGLTAIADMKASHAIVLNLIDLDKVPNFVFFLAGNDPLTSDLISLYSQHNAALPSVLKSLEANSGIDTVLVDANAMYDDFRTRPELYGFRNITGDGFGNGGGACTDVNQTQPDTANCNEYLYWDGTHPTTMAHRYVAELINATVQIVEEDSHRFGSLADSGIVMGRHVSATVGQQVDSWRTGRARAGSARSKDTTFFAKAGFDTGSRQADAAPADYRYSTESLTAGVFSTVRDDLMLGFYLGQSWLDGSFSGEGTFKNGGLYVGGMGAWQVGSLTASAQARVGRTSVTDIVRNTSFSALPVANGETDGLLASGDVELRWSSGLGGRADLDFSGYIGLTGNTSQLTAFEEQDAAYLNMQVNGSTETLVELTAGASASVPLQVKNVETKLVSSVGYRMPIYNSGIVVDGSLSSKQDFEAKSGYGNGGSLEAATVLLVSLPSDFVVTMSTTGGYNTSTDEYYLSPSLGLSKTF